MAVTSSAMSEVAAVFCAGVASRPRPDAAATASRRFFAAALTSSQETSSVANAGW